MFFFFFQAEDGIRDLVRSRGLGDVYKRQAVQLAKPGSVDFVAPGDLRAVLTELGQLGFRVLDLSLIHI